MQKNTSGNLLTYHALTVKHANKTEAVDTVLNLLEYGLYDVSAVCKWLTTKQKTAKRLPLLECSLLPPIRTQSKFQLVNY